MLALTGKRRMVHRASVGSGLLLGTALVAIGTGCGPDRAEEDDPEQTRDAGVKPPLREIENADGCRGLPCKEEVGCAGNALCLHGVCLPNLGHCQSGDDCSNDQRCYDGGCVPFESCSRIAPLDPRCLGGSFSPEQFRAPIVSCHLRDLQVMSTPIVADLDQDGQPEVIATAFPDILVALRPSDCSVRFQRKGLSLLSDGQAQVAAADLDGDGFAEIVTLDAERRILVFDHRGQLLARADVPVRERNPAGPDLWSAPTIADIDGTPPAEIIVGSQVARFWSGPPARVQVLWTQPNLSASWGSVPVVADLDGDGVAEVISSDRIYDGKTGADKTPSALSDDPFYAQVADFTGDKKPDLLLVESTQASQTLRIYDYAQKRTVFGPYTVIDSDGIWGGPAVITDLDRDGIPDFAVASAKRLTAYALRCAKTPKPHGCSGVKPGVLWSRPVDDYSSGSAGIAALDLNSDGVPELVHRDECWLRIFSGLDGRALAARSVMSSTGIELPVLADADGDGRADLVVTSDVPNDNLGACMRVGQPEADTRTPWGGVGGGILVLRDPQNRWTKTRPVWNQHAYHQSHISDALTVPIPTPDSWLSHNSFRQNTAEVSPPGQIPAQYDLTARFQLNSPSRDCRSEWHLSALLCNRGGARTPVPVFGTFYDGDPRSGAQVACTAKLTTPLESGECTDLACDWPSARPGPRTLFLRVGDDGQGTLDTAQCSTGNDLAIWHQASCTEPPR